MASEAAPPVDHLAPPTDVEQVILASLDEIEGWYEREFGMVLRFPANEDDAAVLEWLARHTKQYGDESVPRQRALNLLNEDDTVRSEHLGVMRQIIKENKPRAEALFKLIESTIGQCRRVVEMCNNPIDNEAAREMVVAAVEKVWRKAYDKELEDCKGSLGRIFPSNLAAVNLPKDISDEVERPLLVQKWQRAHGIGNDEVADRVYMNFTRQAREGVEADMESDTCPAQEVAIYAAQFGKEEMLNSLYTILAQHFEDLNSLTNVPGGRGLADALARCEKSVGIMRLSVEEIANEVSNGLTELYAAATIERNRDGVAQNARETARRHFMSKLEERIEVLNESLRLYAVAPGMAVSGLRKAAAKKKRRKGGAPAEDEARTQEMREITLRPGNKLSVDKGKFPWLEGEDDDRSVIIAMQGADHNVAVLDMRTPATKAIEHKMAGYETEEKRQGLLPIITTKLRLIGQMVAGADTTLSKLKHLSDRDAERYRLPISYWGSKSKSQARIYISLVDVTGMPDGEMKNELMAGGIDKAVLFIGACDKNHQSDLMEEFKRFSW